jgi:formate dehydrogenase iron-sulfur subunit
MALRTMFIDTSKCIGCKSCQVACKQWHSLSAESTTFTGSYTNPPAYSGNNLTLVKFTEFVRPKKGLEDARLTWLFFKNQCRHCMRPKCQKMCPKGVKRTSEGLIIFNDNCTLANLRLPTKTPDWTPEEKIQMFKDSCPFKVPAYNTVSGKFVKCDFCVDRFASSVNPCTKRNGKYTTACEFACPSNAIQTGDAPAMTKIIQNRFKVVRKTNTSACIYKGNYGTTQVVYLLTEAAKSYGLGLGLDAHYWD